MGHAMKAFSGDGLTDTGSLFFDPDLSRLTTGRTTSLFAEDIKARDADLRSAFTGRRILVTGAAGSIGSATLELIFQYNPAAVHVIDLAENGLVELVRDFRSRPSPWSAATFRWCRSTTEALPPNDCCSLSRRTILFFILLPTNTSDRKRTFRPSSRCS